MERGKQDRDDLDPKLFSSRESVDARPWVHEELLLVMRDGSVDRVHELTEFRTGRGIENEPIRIPLVACHGRVQSDSPLSEGKDWVRGA